MAEFTLVSVRKPDGKAEVFAVWRTGEVFIALVWAPDRGLVEFYPSLEGGGSGGVSWLLDRDLSRRLVDATLQAAAGDERARCIDWSPLIDYGVRDVSGSTSPVTVSTNVPIDAGSAEFGVLRRWANDLGGDVVRRYGPSEWEVLP